MSRLEADIGLLLALGRKVYGNSFLVRSVYVSYGCTINLPKETDYTIVLLMIYKRC
jgi:hypothetical protein